MKNHSGVCVHEAWPWSSLQKYPPISAQCCAGRAERAQAVLLPAATCPALSAGRGAEQLGKQASGTARGTCLGSWICLLGMLPIHCLRMPREQATDSETKGIDRDFEVRQT